MFRTCFVARVGRPFQYLARKGMLVFMGTAVRSAKDISLHLLLGSGTCDHGRQLCSLVFLLRSRTEGSQVS